MDDHSEAQNRMTACLRAYQGVRDGNWIRGAVTHVIPEFLTALKKEGWTLRRSASKAENIELAARANFENHKDSVVDLFEVEWNALPDHTGEDGHPMLCKEWYRKDVTLTIETLHRAGRLA